MICAIGVLEGAFRAVTRNELPPDPTRPPSEVQALCASWLLAHHQRVKTG